MPYVIGVTGAVGAGKSTVLRWFVRRGISAIDADRVVHGLLEDDDKTISMIAERFEGVLGSDGDIDRAALGALVFDSPDELEALESILHPRVKDVVRAWTESGEAPIVVVEAVKLVESGMHLECDETWLITCESDTRRRRLTTRGWPASEITRRMKAARGMIQRLASASRVIDNSGTESATERQLERALNEVRFSLDQEEAA